MKMKKTDIGVVVFMYAVCGLFLSMSGSLSASSRTYPLFTIALLFGLTTLYLLTMVVKAKKNGVESGKEELLEGFEGLQLLICIVLTVAYMLLIRYLGFFSATILFMLAVLLYLRVPILATVLATAVINLLVYLAFTKFLGVRLPGGLLF